MSIFNLHPFGEIDTKSLEDYYDGNIKFQSLELDLDLNFEKEKVTEKKLEIVRSMIENLEQLDKQNKKYIQDDYQDENEDVTKDYVNFHLYELSSDELATLIDMSSNVTDKKEQLLNKLHLVRVGFYPDCKEHFAVFDYTIGRDLTDQIVVINVDIKSKIHCMTRES